VDGDDALFRAELVPKRGVERRCLLHRCDHHGPGTSSLVSMLLTSSDDHRASVCTAAVQRKPPRHCSTGVGKTEKRLIRRARGLRVTTGETKRERTSRPRTGSVSSSEKRFLR
jgi:hypothetical protein